MEVRKLKASRMLALVVALVMAFAILGGCGAKQEENSDTKPTQQTQKTTAQQTSGQQTTQETESRFTTDEITLLHWNFLNPADTSGRGKVLGDYIKKYEEKYPNVKIQTEVQQWGQLFSMQLAAFHSGSGPDILWISNDDMAGLISVGALEPFENLFLDEWTAEQIADVDDALWGSGTDDGKHYFFALARSIFGIAYRADLFEKYGLGTEYDDIEDFFEALKVFNGVVENGVTMYGYGAGYNPSSRPDNWLCVGLASVGELFHEDGTANFATENGVYLLELQKAMIDDYKITPDVAFSYDNEALYNDFCAGKYAAIPASAARLSRVRNEATFDPMAVQVMKYPSVKGHPSKHLTSGWCPAVSTKSEYKYEAGKFVELLGGPEADWAFCEEAGQVAAYKSTYANNQEFFKKPENEYINVFKDIMDNNIYPIPAFPSVGLKETLLDCFSNYYLNGMSAMDALELAEEEYNERNKDL